MPEVEALQRGPARWAHMDPTFSMRVYAKATRRRSRLSGQTLKAFDEALHWAELGRISEVDEKTAATENLGEGGKPASIAGL